MVNEAAAERISKVVMDAAKLVQVVSAAEAQLTLETFTAAATRIHKIVQTKAHRIIKDELAESGLACIRASLWVQGSQLMTPFKSIFAGFFWEGEFLNILTIVPTTSSSYCRCF